MAAQKLSIYRPERACSQLEIGVKGLQGSVPLQRQEEDFNTKKQGLFGFLEKICLKRNRNPKDFISFRAPDGYVIIYAAISIEKIRKDLVFKFRVENGWLLEPEISFKLIKGKFAGLSVNFYAEAVPLGEGLLKFSDK